MTSEVQDRDRNMSSRFESSRPESGGASTADAASGKAPPADDNRSSLSTVTSTPKYRPTRERGIEKSAPESENRHTEPDRRWPPRAWIPAIFAAKTAGAALLGLLIAFTFNLDQPSWTLLTVFIVSQPQHSGSVLAKCFYRVIGTLIGAAVALILVSLFAQERVLFLGALALWIGLCTFGSQYARNFAAYSFVLSGYTAAIVGIPGALDAGNAFYVATARVTEVCLGIIVAAVVNRIVLPSTLTPALWQSVAEARRALVDYIATVLGKGGDLASSAKLVSKAIAIENQRASAIFEDAEIRERSDSIRQMNNALLGAVGAAQSFGAQRAYLRRPGEPVEVGVDEALSGALSALNLWRSGAIDAAGLHAGLREATTRGSLAQLLFPRESTKEAAIERVAAISGLRELFAALIAYAEAYEACVSGAPLMSGRFPFNNANDLVAALWTGLRAALAVVLTSGFWILSAWPHGSTAVILSAVATARAATMGRAVPLALATTLVFAFSTIPAFLIVEMLLPYASGFPMFALIVGPYLFCCAYLIAKPNPKMMLLGYLSALLFASAGQFQNRMAYDPVGLLNTSIAAVFAGMVTLVMWAVVAPDSAEAARRRFLRIARQAVIRLTAPDNRSDVAEFETRIAESLDQLQSHLRTDRPEDIADLKAAIRLLGAGQELLRRRKAGVAAPTAALGPTTDGHVIGLLEYIRCQTSAGPNKQAGRDAA